MKLLAVAGLVLLSPVCPVFASSFSQLVVFGDSLSDNGNAYTFTKGIFPGSNYGVDTYTGAVVYSDGANTTPSAAGPAGLWVDQLSSKLGVADPQPFLAAAGGTNFAFASAETGKSSLQDMFYQVGAYVATAPTNASTALYAFWGGANDILDGKDPRQAADNIAGYIQELAGGGAKNFVWLNLPLLGDTPDGAPAKTQLNAASTAFNSEWTTDVAALKGSGVNVVGVDIEQLFSSLIGNPGAHGFTNVTDAAQKTTGLASDAGYLFWDGKHPTTQGHALIADEVESSLVPTPEPASVSFAIIGVLAIAGLGFRKRTAQLNQ